MSDCGGIAAKNEGNTRYSMKCNGTAECPVHPHIGQDHPIAPVQVRFEDGEARSYNYSDEWNKSSKEWEDFKNTEFGKSILNFDYNQI